MSAPPRLAVALMEWSLARSERAAVLGDLEENYTTRCESADRRAASSWYWRQTLESVVPNLVRRFRRDKPFRQLVLGQGASAVALMVYFWASANRAPDSQMVAGLLAALYFINSRRLNWGDSPLEFTVRVVLDLTALASVFLNVGLPGMLVTIAGRPWGKAARTVWPDDAWIVRGPASPGELPFANLTTTVPNRKLGMSGLVLVTTMSVNPHVSPETFEFLRAGRPTIRREFGRATTLRVFTAAYVEGRPITASLDVVARDGRVVRVITPVITTGDMEQVRQPWGQDGMLDARGDFARVDAQLPLADLAPGRYTLRLTITDGANTAKTDDVVTVYDSPGDRKADSEVAFEP